MAMFEGRWRDDSDEPDFSPHDAVTASQGSASKLISARPGLPEEALFSDFVVRSTGMNMGALGVAEYFDILAEAAFRAPCNLEAADVTHKKLTVAMVEIIQVLKRAHDDHFELRLDLLAEIQRRSVSPEPLIDLIVRTEQEMWREPQT